MYSKRETVDLKTLIPSKSLKFLYLNKFGRVLLKLLCTKAVSSIAGAFLSTPLSVPMIKGFVEKNNIDLDMFEDKNYKNYNEFFSRKIKEQYRPMSENPLDFISPADSKLTVYKITEDLKFNIKNSFYSVKSLLEDDATAQGFKDGYILIFRLCVDDYHRYCFVDNGKVVLQKAIAGKFHTVQPIALEKDDFFKENSRVVTVIDTATFGRVAQVEIGAMMVGKIVNHPDGGKAIKGAEKGYFKFGGSTVAVLVPKEKIKIDDEILLNTKNGLETVVKYRETIGYKI